MAPECMVPIGEGALGMCWLCAHNVIDHGGAVGAVVLDCGCKREDIYPPHVLKSFDAIASKHGPNFGIPPGAATLRQTYMTPERVAVRTAAAKPGTVIGRRNA